MQWGYRLVVFASGRRCLDAGGFESLSQSCDDGLLLALYVGEDGVMGLALRHPEGSLEIVTGTKASSSPLHWCPSVLTLRLAGIWLESGRTLSYSLH